jgi:hypothetical protein
MSKILTLCRLGIQLKQQNSQNEDNTMTAFYFLGNGDYTIKPRKTVNHPSGYGIWNNSSNSWHTSSIALEFVWPSRDSLVQWLANRYLYVHEDKILNPYGKISHDLLALQQLPTTSYDERIVIGLVLDSISDIVAYGVNRKGRLTANLLEHTPKT